jgi:hypothetical protein
MASAIRPGHGSGVARSLTGTRVVRVIQNGRLIGMVPVPAASHCDRIATAVNNELYANGVSISHPLISTSPLLPLASGITPGSSLLKQPGQLCSTMCANMSQSMQKCPSHALHSYLPDSLAFCSSLSSASLLVPFVSPFCSICERWTSEAGGSEKALRQPTHSLLPFSRARAQLTMAQLRRGKR